MSLTITIPGAVNVTTGAMAPAVLTIGVGVPGATGPAGPGVPVGGTAGQYLQKIDGTNYNTDWVTLNLAAYAPLASPLFTGDPQAPTPALGDNDTSLATTAFVQQELLSGTANARNLEVYVRNQTGSTLAAGTIVYINGATGNRPTVTPAQANNDANSAQTFGFTKASIANNGFGFVIVRGELENIDTSALTEGVQLYLSPTTPGTWTTTKPSAPQHLVYVGIVVRAHPTQGVILVAVQNGFELDELHDVQITSPTNGQVLKYNSSTSLWYNGTDSAGVAWGGITGTLSSQTDLQTALDGKYSTTNPAGYITSSALTGYATESFVTSQGYITSSALTPYLTSATAASTYQTLSGMSSYLTTATAASTYQTISGMSSYLTTASAASTYFTIASAANKADLASPALTGTPTAPTASPGTDSTQLATTAFVQQEVPAASTTAAGKVELATFIEATRFNSQSLATTPTSLLGLIAANGGPVRPRSSAFTSASSGAGASAASYYGATICYGPSASTVGYGGVYFKAEGYWASNNAYTTPDWSKVTGFSMMAYRPTIAFGSGNTIRITLGKAASGGTLSTRGIGVDIAAANTYAKILAHNGTTLTTTDSTFLVSNYANLSTRNITMVSYGNGTVELFVNGVSYGTSSGGPTTAGGTGTRYSEEVYGDGTQTGAMQLWTFNASVFTGL
jgi:hypothetical protein